MVENKKIIVVSSSFPYGNEKIYSSNQCKRARRKKKKKISAAGYEGDADEDEFSKTRADFDRRRPAAKTRRSSKSTVPASRRGDR